MSVADDQLRHLHSLLDAPASRARALEAYQAVADACNQLYVPMIQGRVVSQAEAQSFAAALVPMLHQAAHAAARWAPIEVRNSLRSLGRESPPVQPACEAILEALTQPPKASSGVVPPALREVLTPFERRAARAPGRHALVTPGDAGPLEALADRHQLALPPDVRDLYTAVAVLESKGDVSLRLVPADHVALLPADDELPARWHVLTVIDVTTDVDDILHLGCFLRDGRTHWSFERTHSDFGSLRHQRAATVAEVLSFASGPRVPGPHDWQAFFLGAGPRSLYVVEAPGLGPREDSILSLHIDRRELVDEMATLLQETVPELIELFTRSADATLAVHVIENDRRQSVIDLRPLVSAKVGPLPRTPLSGLAALRRKVGASTFDSYLQDPGTLALHVPTRSLTAAIPKLTGTRLERGRTLRLQGRVSRLPRVLALGSHDMDGGTWILSGNEPPGEE